MQHMTMTVKATATDQELGQFSAIASSWSLDRERDEIDRHAFDRTIEAWQRAGRNLPVLWEHSSDVVGHIDPDSMHTDERGLIVAGAIDRESEKGDAAWRMIKNNVAAFSIGFMAESRRKGGGRVLTEIDLLEVSITSRPMHPAARTLSWKAAVTEDDPLPWRQQKRYVDPSGKRLDYNELLAYTKANSARLRKQGQAVQIREFPC